MNGKTFQGIVRQEKFEISFLLVLRILIVCRLVIQIAIRRRVFYRNVFFDRLLIGEAYGFGGKLGKTYVRAYRNKWIAPIPEEAALGKKGRSVPAVQIQVGVIQSSGMVKMSSVAIFSHQLD